MLLSVKEVSEMAHVTIKTLHHYHKIGLLKPTEISEAGYRLYGEKELQRLQEILFYRELEFSLDQIKEIMNSNPDRKSILEKQEALLISKSQRLHTLIDTIKLTITSMKEGITMENNQLFAGFANERQWNEALEEQSKYLEETYGMEPLKVQEADVQTMNEQAAEAVTFMSNMAESLRAGLKHNEAKIADYIKNHLDFLNRHGHKLSALDFASQTKFFLQDDFHLSMLEAQQTGLAYYLAAAAEAYQAQSKR
ncbi:MerR family transcriptional regulator [Paenibacillus sp. BK720]|uniref:MerR family transcriptional regulator n=1 Tax=Paenibacillus sp. BK720 TaxID=2587092 RepID=UPI00142189AD|nr:MerR family transcriptional regulator [Paenibacillus sp. BK720]NIK68990.1 DNA-binding transcriptional MerR regulator [Paenibacillus sp. BK720]